MGGYYASAQAAHPLTATEPAPERMSALGIVRHGQLRLWVLVALGIALFILFFLIGYYMPYRLGG